MHYKDGSSALITILLMIIIIVVASLGFMLFVVRMNDNASEVINNTGNLSGISYTSDMYNITSRTLHGAAATMPNLIWLVFIFLIVVFITLLVIGLKRH